VLLIAAALHKAGFESVMAPERFDGLAPSWSSRLHSSLL